MHGGSGACWRLSVSNRPFRRPRRALAQGDPIDNTDEYTSQVCTLEDESSAPAEPQELNCDKVAGGMFSSDRTA